MKLLNIVLVATTLVTSSCAHAFGPGRDPASPGVDPNTLNKKMMMGYQGWFTAKGDGSPIGTWFHWSKNGERLDAKSLNVDMWPDLSEFGADELFSSSLAMPDGSPAKAFSSYNRKTVLRHMEWAADYGIDGMFLQRFVSELSWPNAVLHRNEVAKHIKEGSEIHGRVFAMMYDMAGSKEETFVDDIIKDWKFLVDNLKLTESKRYLKHRGKPVLAIWGIGFDHIAGDPKKLKTLVHYLTEGAAPKYRVTLMGGVPEGWRTLTGSSKKDREWADVYRSLDVISPWTVGRYGDEAEVRQFRKNFVDQDIRDAKRAGADYLPVIFPGFSWRNLQGGNSKLNQIPRQGGRFWWSQAYEFTSAGVTMLYGAMFDEVDESTAMFKLAADAKGAPVGVPMVTLDIDGEKLPSDWYLRVAGEGARMLRGEIPRTATLPLKP